jgi:hypothetical protein
MGSHSMGRESLIFEGGPTNHTIFEGGQIFLLGTVPAITSYANSRVRGLTSS